MRKDIVATTFLTLVLIGAILWAANNRWHLIGGPAPTPTPAARLEAQGEWRGAPEVIGALFLATCHNYLEPFTALRPTPPGLVRTVAQAWPEKPADKNYIALSGPIYIPRRHQDVGTDTDAWLQQHGTRPDCSLDPWTEQDVTAVREVREIGLFGVARPVARNGHPLWEMAFGVVRWSKGR